MIGRRDLFRGFFATLAAVALAPLAPIKRAAAFVSPPARAFAGFRALMWRGVPIYWDSRLPGGTIYYMDHRYVTDPATWGTIADWMDGPRPSELAPLFDAARGARRDFSARSVSIRSRS